MARTRIDLVVSTAVAANRAPVWADPLVVQIVDGVAQRIPARQFVTDPDGDALTIAVAVPMDALAQARGFSYDEATDELVYDGTPTGVMPDAVHVIETGLRLSADDGRV